MSEREYSLFWPLEESISLDSLILEAERLARLSRNLFFASATILISQAIPVLKQSIEKSAQSALFLYVRTLEDFKKHPNLPHYEDIVCEAEVIALRRLLDLTEQFHDQSPYLRPRLEDIPSIDDFLAEDLIELVPEDFQGAFIGIVRANQHFSQLVEKIRPISQELSL